MTHVNYNGKLYEEGTALIGADNRGIRYGDGLFETVKMKAGKIVFEKAHFDRLWRGLSVLGFEVPKHFTKEKLIAEIYALCKKNKTEEFGRIRLNIFRGDGGLYDAKSYAPQYIIQCWALSKEYEAWNSNGLVLGIYTDVTKSQDILANIKHNNFLPYVLGARKAQLEKWNDAILLNTSGKLCDTTIANIFIIKNGIVFTPSLNQACVAGVTRKALVDHLQKNGWDVMEKELSVDDLRSADEVFLTNSMYNIRWVASVQESRYANTITQKIYASFVSTIL